jgi:hypothetical protein
MADVIASCEKCGAFVQAAHVTPGGLVAMDPTPTAMHWESSPDCRGSYGLVSVEAFQQAAAMAKSVITARKEAKRPLLQRFWLWLTGPVHRWQMRRYLDRMEEGG